jgi:nitrogen fixation-related uncharacterized protein
MWHVIMIIVAAGAMPALSVAALLWGHDSRDRSLHDRRPWLTPGR